MAAKLKIRDASGWTIFVFGALALLLGLTGLIRPELLLSILGFPVLDRAARVAGDYTIVYITASSMASFNMDVYYVLVALNDWKPFYKWTVPFRCVTFIVFTTASLTGLALARFIGVRFRELSGAIATWLALRSENKKNEMYLCTPIGLNINVHRTAVLGVTGMKRQLADLLTALTGQPLRYFDHLESAKNWLIED